MQGSPASHDHEDKVLLVLTLIIGAVVGLVVVAFILLTENLTARFYAAGTAPWMRFLIPVAGATGTGFFLYRYFPNARGSGIPQAKTALFIRDGFISMRTVLGKFGLCSVSLASGIALGREGPCVQVGSGIASVLGRRLGLTPASVKALVPVGASAALAAAFNTPIAAVLFSLEEVMGDMHAPVLGSIVLGSATSWIVLHLLLGDEPLFHVPTYQLVHPVEFVFYAALGVAGGLISVAFVKLLLWQRKYFLRAPKSMQWFMPGVGGLTVGLLALAIPEVLGVGYNYVGQALNGQMVVSMMALLAILKLVSTATCYASGNAGGIFGPSLFIGAMLGGAVGGTAHLLMPDYTGSVGAYALVGMGTAFAGIIRTPLTSVIMIFEITRDYSIIVPLMISNLVSFFISSKLQEEPIYDALLHQDGIHLPGGARAREANMMVGNAFRVDVPALSATETIARAAASVDREAGAWPVVDAAGLRGMVTSETLEDAVQAQRGDEPLAALVPDPGPADRLTAENFPHLHIDHPLEMAMRRIAHSGPKTLPVVSRSNVRELKGTISVSDILAAYGVGKVKQEPAAEAPLAAKAPGRLLAVVVAALVLLAIGAGLLNYFSRAQRASRAQHFLQEANELFAKERYDEAVTEYRNALSITHSVETRLALGTALVKAGRPNEASIYLEEVLRERPDDARAHLALARTYAKQGSIRDAVLEYHRAIYGHWPDRQQENRFQGRIELVEMLERASRRKEAQAELLEAVTEAPADPASQKQLGRMLIDYGMARQAADVFRNLAQSSREAEAYRGLGDAELELGDVAAARDAYRQGLKVDPSDTAAAKKLDLCERVLALDPSARGLSAAERYRRSRELLANVAECAGAEPPPEPKRRPRSFSDAADANIAEALKLWDAGAAACTSADALARVMAKLRRA